MRWIRAWRRLVLAGVAALLLAGAPAQAADPGRWIETGFSAVPFEYYQGLTSDPLGSLYFDGFTVGVYRTNAALAEQARVGNVIPAAVARAEGYNHIGDPAWDGAEGGRLLLPLECFQPFVGNFCGTGSIGVADPASLAWRYYVKLDSSEIKKAMWVEDSPDGRLLWTSDRGDLLAYRASDVSPANAAPAGPAISPVRRLVGAVPPSGVTGAAFHDGRLFLAGQVGRRQFQVWSVDTETGERRLEIEREIFGESEGIDFFDGLGGRLHWLIGESSFGGPPTYGSGHSALVHFAPANRAPDCSGALAAPSELGPPNHKLAPVALGGVTDPDGDPLTIEVTGVSQDEPVNGRGDGNTAPDAAPAETAGAVLVRAERAGGDDGRVYRVAFRASDSKGASCNGSVAVGVPRGKGGTRDSAPPAYDSLSTGP